MAGKVQTGHHLVLEASGDGPAIHVGCETTLCAYPSQFLLENGLLFALSAASNKAVPERRKVCNCLNLTVT